LIREAHPRLPIIAGNVASAAGVAFLAESGANAIKIGQGPGSICTTRIVAGVGVPQLTALYLSSRAAQIKGVTILADGGVTKSGDVVKALTQMFSNRKVGEFFASMLVNQGIIAKDRELLTGAKDTGAVGNVDP